MAETQAVRFFFRQVADHVSGVKAMEPEHAKAAAELLRQIADSKPAPDGGWQVPKPPVKARITHQVVLRRILAMEKHTRLQAESVKGSPKKWERELVAGYNEDADDYKKLATLVKAKKWARAVSFWESLDTFVRDGVPSEHIVWMVEQWKRQMRKVK
jgi:hypothetical protein